MRQRITEFDTGIMIGDKSLYEICRDHLRLDPVVLTDGMAIENTSEDELVKLYITAAVNVVEGIVGGFVLCGEFRQKDKIRDEMELLQYVPNGSAPAIEITSFKVDGEEYDMPERFIRSHGNAYFMNMEDIEGDEYEIEYSVASEITEGETTNDVILSKDDVVISIMLLSAKYYEYREEASSRWITTVDNILRSKKLKV
jgi:hypothetical protein